MCSMTFLEPSLHLFIHIWTPSEQVSTPVHECFICLWTYLIHVLAPSERTYECLSVISEHLPRAIPRPVQTYLKTFWTSLFQLFFDHAGAVFVLPIGPLYSWCFIYGYTSVDALICSSIFSWIYASWTCSLCFICLWTYLWMPLCYIWSPSERIHGTCSNVSEVLLNVLMTPVQTHLKSFWTCFMNPSLFYLNTFWTYL